MINKGVGDWCIPRGCSVALQPTETGLRTYYYFGVFPNEVIGTFVNSKGGLKTICFEINNSKYQRGGTTFNAMKNRYLVVCEIRSRYISVFGERGLIITSNPVLFNWD